jgi:release factor glutamine methyltransferase
MNNTIKQMVEKFYQTHCELLHLNYPGLKVSRLLDEYLYYSQKKSDETYLGEGQHFFNEVLAGKPLEYICQNKFFYKSNFFVNEDVLIPRSETEILADYALQKIKTSHYRQICEVGVGSGCLILTLAMECEHKLDLLGTDISREALAVAKINYMRHKHSIPQGTTCEFRQNDRLQNMTQKFDLIVTNPPYIHQQKDRSKVHHQVLKYEPAQALFLADDNYWDWFDIFFQQIASCLNVGGTLLMEGHEDHLARLATMASQYFQQIQIHKDYQNLDRFLEGKKHG